jgi:hypothetical protein
MAYKFNPFTGNFDVTLSISELDDRYVNITGDTMTGSLDMQKNAIIMQSANNTRFDVIVENTANLKTTAKSITNNGIPYGLLLTLTQPS